MAELYSDLKRYSSLLKIVSTYSSMQLFVQEHAMADLDQLCEQVLQFRNERDWSQYHTPKDMALSLILEASELLEHFQWKDQEGAIAEVALNRESLGDELADVLYWVLLMAHDFEIDLGEAFERKMAKNRQKYPVERFRGSNKKYNQSKVD